MYRYRFPHRPSVSQSVSQVKSSQVKSSQVKSVSQSVSNSVHLVSRNFISHALTNLNSLLYVNVHALLALSFSRWCGDLCSLDFFCTLWFVFASFLSLVLFPSSCSVTLLLVILLVCCCGVGFCFASFGLVSFRSLCSVPRLLGFMHIARCSLFSIVLLTGLVCEVFCLNDKLNIISV